MKRKLKLFFLMIKRLFCRMSYILILIAIPLFSLMINMMSGKDESMVRLLAVDQEMSEESSAFIHDLVSMDGVISVEVQDDFDDAINRVKSRQCDALLIVKEGFADAVLQMSKDGTLLVDPPVEIYEGEDTVRLKLARIKVFSELYPSIAYKAYQFETEDCGVDEQTRKSVYEKYKVTDKMFVSKKIEKNAEDSFLVAPVKGLMSVIVMISGFLGMVYLFEDDQNGLFANRGKKDYQRCSYIYVASSVLPVLIASEVPIVLLKMNHSNAWHEILSVVFFAITTILFARLVGVVLRRGNLLVQMLPAIILLFLIICPIFMNFRILKPLQLVIPACYYLNFDFYDSGVRDCTVFLVILLALNKLIDIFGARKEG